MNKYIGDVVPRDIEFAEPVIKGKSEINNGPGFQDPLYRKKAGQVSNLFVFYNTRMVIKYKWIAADVAVEKGGSQRNQN